jgi:hypothetical protein
MSDKLRELVEKIPHHHTVVEGEFVLNCDRCQFEAALAEKPAVQLDYEPGLQMAINLCHRQWRDKGNSGAVEMALVLHKHLKNKDWQPDALLTREAEGQRTFVNGIEVEADLGPTSITLSPAERPAPQED